MEEMVRKIKLWKSIYAGLQERGFGPFDGSESSKGRCHTPDEKHYILFTDGLIIYSTIPHWDQKYRFPSAIVHDWYFEDFKFSDLDSLMEMTA